MSSTPFVHLHCHSHYSFYDGTNTIEQLVGHAAQLGMNALALTDHGNLHGAVKFYQACEAAGVRAVIGYEAYIAYRPDAFEPYHLTLIAQNRTGFRNLIRMASRAYLNGYRHLPCIDHDLLSECAEGLICLSGCLKSEFSQAILRNANAGVGDKFAAHFSALKVAAWHHSLFGDRYFIEIQSHGLDRQQQVTETAGEIARWMGIPTVATNNVHYLRPKDAVVQDVLQCLNAGQRRSDASYRPPESDQRFFRTAEEMLAAMPDEEDAIRRTQDIADSVELELEFGKKRFPSVQVPADKTASEHLRELCVQGLTERYGDRPRRCNHGVLVPHVQDRLDRELAEINQRGLVSDFLVAGELVHFAAARRIAYSALGSVGGLLVSYSLRLSHVCPLDHRLLSECYLSDDGVTPPAINIDISRDRRHEMLEHAREVYGDANVAEAGTFAKRANRAAIYDVGRVLDMPLSRVDEVFKMLPVCWTQSIDDAISDSDALQRAYREDHQIRDLLDLAHGIKDLLQYVSGPTAAVAISDQSLEALIPWQTLRGKTKVFMQWSQRDVAAIGLMQIGLLPQRGLTLLERTIQLIEEDRGELIDLYALPPNDHETYAQLCCGVTNGIVQLAGDGMQDILQRLQPSCLNDLAAAIALYRPGPLDSGLADAFVDAKSQQRTVGRLHPMLEELLGDTYGLPLYVEQVMVILNRLGGIPLPAAYTVVRGFRGSTSPAIAKYRAEFIAGAATHGIDDETAAAICSLIEKSTRNLYSRSHALSYAFIAYAKAYLKMHYEAEFAAAEMSTANESLGPRVVR